LDGPAHHIRQFAISPHSFTAQSFRALARSILSMGPRLRNSKNASRTTRMARKPTYSPCSLSLRGCPPGLCYTPAKIPFEKLIVGVLPYLFVLLGCLLLFTLFPDYVLWLPRLVGYM